MRYLFIILSLFLLTSCGTSNDIENTIEEELSHEDQEPVLQEEQSSVSSAKAAALAKAKAKFANKKEIELQKDTQNTGDVEKYVYDYPYVCSVGSSITQYYYPKGDMILTVTSIPQLKSISYHLMTEKGDYSWSNLSGTISGSFFSATNDDDTFNFTPEQLAQLKKTGEAYAKNNCQKWTLDTSFFELPNITFVDLDTFPDYGGDEEENKMTEEDVMNLIDPFATMTTEDFDAFLNPLISASTGVKITEDQIQDVIDMYPSMTKEQMIQLREALLNK